MSTGGSQPLPNEVPNAHLNEDVYVNWRETAKTYRNYKGTPMGMSPGMLRAREPYKIPNAITGVCLTLFIGAVYWYSLAAVKQENFDDVDDEARAMFESRSASTAATAAATTPASTLPLASAVSPVPAAPRGVLSPILDRALPRLLDPQRKTLVWGAPPVDAIGKLSDRRP